MATYISPVSGDWAGNSSNLFAAHRTRKGGGERYHAGNDLHAANGSKANATIGGTVLYTGDNTGYRWNATVLGDDGNIYRYATHGPLSVEPGQRVEQGQAIGTIAQGHLHFEVIPPQSPVYDQMVANPSAFIDTQWYPGGKPLSVNPAVFFGVKPGTKITAGQEIGTVPGSQELAIASFTAANQSPQQIAALQQQLQAQGLYGGAIDGVWGRGTQGAFEQYAAANGVPGGTTAAAAEPVDPVTQKLAATMLTENRGGGDEGMIDVGNVALNRVRDTSGKWADDLDGVLNTDHFAIKDLSSFTPEEQARALNIAAQLQSGDITDTTGGATSFLTKGTTADWAGKPGFEFISNKGGIDLYGQGQFDDETEVATNAPAAAPQTTIGTAFAELPEETPASAVPAVVRSVAPAAPVQPASITGDTAAAVLHQPKSTDYSPVTPLAFAPITEARTKDDAFAAAFAPTPETAQSAGTKSYTPFTHLSPEQVAGYDAWRGTQFGQVDPDAPTPFAPSRNPLDGITLGPDYVEDGVPFGEATAFTPIAGRDPLTGATTPYDFSGIYASINGRDPLTGASAAFAPPPAAKATPTPAEPTAAAAAFAPTDWAAGRDQYAPMLPASSVEPYKTLWDREGNPGATAAFADPTGPALATPATTLGYVNPTPPATHRPPTVPENVAEPPEPVADTAYPTPAIATPKKDDPLKGVGKTVAKGAFNLITGGIPGLIGGLIFNNSGKGVNLFEGFGGPQVFNSGGPSGTTPNGWNYQTGTGIQDERSTQFTKDGRTYTYTDQSDWGQPSIGGWSK